MLWWWSPVRVLWISLHAFFCWTWCVCHWVCVCACVCVRLSVCASLSVCVHVCYRVSVCVCVHKYVCVCVCVYVYAMHVCVCECVGAHACVFMLQCRWDVLDLLMRSILLLMPITESSNYHSKFVIFYFIIFKELNVLVCLFLYSLSFYQSETV